MIPNLTDKGLELELASAGARFTPVQLQLPEDLPESDWAQIGRTLIRADQVIQWWLGDWAQFGAGHPEKPGWRKKGALIEFCKVNGVDYGNLRNKSYVSGNIHLSLRHDKLPWSYYETVAPLKPKEQRAWLAKAMDQDFTRAALRREIRLSNGEQSALNSDGPVAEFGTDYFEDLKGWLLKRPVEFWTPGRREIWQERISELARIVAAN